jgi:hypothetical protein
MRRGVFQRENWFPAGVITTPIGQEILPHKERVGMMFQVVLPTLRFFTIEIFRFFACVKKKLN